MALPLTELLVALEALAPLELAEEWDNVGLLVDPRGPGEELTVERVLLTIDATPAVAREAASSGVECVVAYHPPLFRARKRLSRAADPLVFAAAMGGFAVYSPHSALDAAAGGLNDWLAEAFLPGEVRPLQDAAPTAGHEYKLVVFVPEDAAERVREALAEAGAGCIGKYSHCSFELPGEGTFFGREGTNPVVGDAGRLERVRELRLEMICPKTALSAAAAAIRRAHPYEEPAWDVYPLTRPALAGAGSGRRIELAEPATLTELVARVKAHLGLSHVRVAVSDAHRGGAPIRRVAVQAGSGGGSFAHGASADLYVTGELGHHATLEKLARGASVILCEHTNTERGYLPRFGARLVERTAGRVEVRVSTADVEPIAVV